MFQRHTLELLALDDVVAQSQLAERLGDDVAAMGGGSDGGQAVGRRFQAREDEFEFAVRRLGQQVQRLGRPFQLLRFSLVLSIHCRPIAVTN